MKFYLVDKIEQVIPGKRIVTTKALSLAEEYLADHFPAFPVMPGVLMIESLVQAAAWLVRIQQEFTKSIVVLQAARNIRYARFVRPGDLMRAEIDALEITDTSAKVKGAGYVGDETCVSGRLELRCFNLAETAPHLASADEDILADLKKRFELIGGPAVLAAATTA
jgi:3-hydroxyacyl-[acyl-carrier-protein] dehydratase